MMLWVAGASRADDSDACPPAPLAACWRVPAAAWTGSAADLAADPPDPLDDAPELPAVEQPATSRSPAPVRSAAHEMTAMRGGIPRPRSELAARSGRPAPAGLTARRFVLVFMLVGRARRTAGSALRR
jgi:hypothetical protein